VVIADLEGEIKKTGCFLQARQVFLILFAANADFRHPGD
jgi:hypothetical protein